MSEAVQKAAISLLANESPSRLGRLLKAGPGFLLMELKTNWLPKGPEKNLQPDSQESNEAATVDAQNQDKAETTFQNLDVADQKTLLKAVELLSNRETAALLSQQLLGRSLAS